MKHTYPFIQTYFLNSAYSFSLFGVYALTIAPFINNFIELGEPNAFIGIFGFTMLIAEFFALRFKLKIIRIRTQLKRIEYKKKTGIDVIPSVTAGVLFGLFSRLIFHVIIIMISMSSFGFECSERLMSPHGIIAIMAGFLLEMAAIVYFFMKLDIYTDIPLRRKQFLAEVNEDNKWVAANLDKELSEYSARKEMFADIILQIFSCMLFSSCWHLINQNGIQSLISLYKHHIDPISSFLLLFPIMFATIVIALRPMHMHTGSKPHFRPSAQRKKRKTGSSFLLLEYLPARQPSSNISSFSFSTMAMYPPLFLSISST